VSLAIAIGRENFMALLAGGYAMDEHFRTAPWQENLPVLMALSGIWNINFNAQHSFFQLLHQGTPRAALDFLVPAQSSCGDQAHQNLAIANCFAQAEAFMNGQAEHHLTFPKARPRDARLAHRALRAQVVHAGRGVGDQLL